MEKNIEAKKEQVKINTTGKINKVEGEITQEVKDQYLNSPVQLFQNMMKEKKLYINIADPSEAYMFDVKLNTVQTISLSNLRAMYGNGYSDLIFKKGHFSIFSYDPFARWVSKTVNIGEHHLNLYNPPFWLEDFHRGLISSIPIESSIPKVYSDFFMHLVGNDTASYEYLISWLANAIKKRNNTILTCVGEQGIGKGILGNIMEKLFGANYVVTDDRVLKTNFNSELRNKQLIHIDEINIKSNSMAVNRLKGLTNDSINIEEKGKPRKSVNNFASVYICTNDIDGLPIEEGDRRFSLIHLTSEKLYEKYDYSEIEDMCIQLYLLENIKNLGNYLFHYNVGLDMNVPFRDEQLLKDIKEAQLKDWQRYILDVLVKTYNNQEVKAEVLQKELKDKFGFHVGILKLANFGKESKSYVRKQYKDRDGVNYFTFPDTRTPQQKQADLQAQEDLINLADEILEQK